MLLHQPRRPPWTRTAYGTRRRAAVLLVLLGLVALAAAVAGHGVGERLAPGGWTPATAQSTRADAFLAARFGAGQPHLMLLATSKEPVDSPEAARAGRALTDRLTADPRTAWVHGYWPRATPELRGRDGHTAVVAVRFKGDERAVLAAGRAVAASETGRAGPLRVSVAGEAALFSEMERLSTKGALIAEIVVAPVVLLILLWVFGSVVAALLPVAVGAFAVLTTTALLRALSEVMTVSVFVLNIATALGFGLAVDYCLLLVSRCREELADGTSPVRAVERAVRTAGRAVLFSATTIAAVLGTLMVFPLTLTRSLAVGGAAVALCSAAGALLVLPALLVLLGEKVNAWDAFARWRTGPGRPVAEGRWYRLAMWVTRRPVLVTLGTLLLLGLLAAPGAGARFGMYDDRVLPASSPVAQASQRLRQDFAGGSGAAATVVLPHLRVPPVSDASAGTAAVGDASASDASGGTAPAGDTAADGTPGGTAPAGDTAANGTPGGTTSAGTTPAGDGSAAGEPAPAARAGAAAATRVHTYAARLSGLPGVRQVRTATGVYHHGRRIAAAGPWAAGFTGPAGTWLDVTPTSDSPLSPDGRLLTERLREEPAPARALVGGPGARLTDTEQALTGPLPLAMLLTVVATLVLLFLYTRSLLVPVKAVLLNALSLAATFGIIVAVFQQGRLEVLLGHAHGPATTDVVIPAVMFCTAFGLSMDYEVFLLSRILEEHRRGTPTGLAVAVGLQRTGRLFTSAALIFAVVMASLAACDLIMLQFIGFGLAVAVVIDCTLVRALLVPAIMSLAGRANWWPAKRLRRVAE
ncbi:MMPL family transporter [Streptomyces triculaminicus]|uniref:MMPL family transporter n=1 Tax=Streptomyces triculaminicus TaxID=2816232 RepID=A0A939FL19_9ACTN|nr:MMPL family transporter [Streptomyces triculaminicus]MBO0654106.1 MMPL family transporter [Streptomyces triculaminicus]